MKQNIKKHTKVWLSAFLTLVIVLQTFAGIEFDANAEETNITYTTEKKFTDWKVSQDLYEDYQVYTLSEASGITSLDGVKVEGKVDFKGDASAHFRIGGTDDEIHAGFSFMTQEETGDLILWAQEIGNNVAYPIVKAYEWATLIHTEVVIGVGFTKNDAGNWIVEVFINNESRGTYNFGTVNPGLYLANKGVEFIKTYKEMDFGDWKHHSTDATAGVYLPESITSLDGVAVSGTVNFNGSIGGSVIIGGASVSGGFAVSTDGTDWIFKSQSIGGTDTDWVKMANPNGVCKPNSDVELRMTFDKTSTTDTTATWKVKVYADGQEIGKYDIASSTTGTGVYLTISNAVTVYHMQKYDLTSYKIYKELKFTDWGRHVAKNNDYNMYQLTDSSLLNNGSLDGVAISGIVNFNSTTWKTISFGGQFDAQHGGFRIANIGQSFSSDTDGETGDETPIAWGWDNVYVDRESDKTTTTDWAEVGQNNNTGAYVDGDVLLRVTFNFDSTTKKWTMNVYAKSATAAGNPIHVGSATPEIEIDLGNYMSVSTKIAVDMPTPTEMNFSDWGIYEGEVDGFDVYSLSDKSKITSLDKVAIEGTVDYNGDPSAYFRIGGYWKGNDDNRAKGICFGKENAENYTLWTEGITATGANPITPWEMPVNWVDYINKPFKLRIELFKDMGTGNWSCLILIDGNMIQCYDLGVIEPGLYMSSYATLDKGLNATPDVEGIGPSDLYIKHNKGYYGDDGKYYFDKAYTLPTSIDHNSAPWTVESRKINNAAITDLTYGNIGQHIMGLTCRKDGQLTFEQARKLVVYIVGDANCDDSVDVGDVVRMMRWEKNPELFEMNLVHTLSSDADNDGGVTTADTTKVFDLVFDKRP